MTTKKLSSLKDFQDENLTVITKMQMATVVGGGAQATYGIPGATKSNKGYSDTLTGIWVDNDGKQGAFLRSECIDEMKNVLEPGEYTGVE